MAYQLSKEEIKQEILRCGKDPVYFITNYAKIGHPIRGSIPLKLYPFQEEVIREFNDHRFNIVLKARQLGLSTVTAAYIAWLMLFRKDKTVLIIATKLGTAANLLKKTKYIISNIPDWLMITKIKTDNRNVLELENGSWFKASSTSGDAGRSEALSLLIIDEAALVDNLEELWAGLYPTLSTGGNCIAISTPKGVGNWFQKTYTSAEDGQNDFNPIKLPWSVHPERDQAWFEKETKNMSPREIAQELECNFNMSGETFLSADIMKELERNILTPKYKGFDGDYWIWETYSASNQYILVADVARGDGADFQAFHVLSVEPFVQVAEYYGKTSLDNYSRLIYQVSKEYGNALTIVENAAMGLAVLEKLIDLGHKNLYYSLKGSGEYMEQLRAQYSTSAVPGFTTNQRTRPLVTAKLEEMIRNKMIRTSSERTFKEFSSFIWNNGRAQATRSTHDDLIMSLAIGCYIRDTVFEINKTEMEYKKAMAGAIMVSKGTNQINSMVGVPAGYELNARRKDEFGNVVIDLNVKEYKQNNSFVLPYPIIIRG